MSDVKIENNAPEVIAELNRRLPIITEAVGLEAEGNAIKEITDMKAVDTGRLRNSITFATTEKQGAANTQPAQKPGGKAEPADYEMHATPEAGATYIGTNVEYAPFIEKGRKGMKGRPFLQNAVANYKERYVEIMKDGLKG